MNKLIWQQRYTILFIVCTGIFVAAFLISNLISEAQTTKPVETCNNTEVYKDGDLIFKCKIVSVNGTPVIQETDAKGTVTERAASTIEAAIWESDTARKQCEQLVSAGRLRLATPVRLASISDLQERLQALETIVTVECS